REFVIASTDNLIASLEIPRKSFVRPDDCSVPELRGLKVCFLAGTLEHGGAERQLLYMLEALCRCGAVPRVLCLDRGEFWEAAIHVLGVPLTGVGERPPRLDRLFRIVKELQKDPPDILQSQHFFANAYAGMAARLLRRKKFRIRAIG